MSAIDVTDINENFPVQGRDNPSVGFQNNFGAIKLALQVAKDEIADLQTKSVLSEVLGTEGGVIENNLQGSNIQNGTYSQFNAVFLESASGLPNEDITINLASGPVQEYTMYHSGTTNFLWANWIDSNTQYATVRLIFKTGAAGTMTLTFGDSEVNDMHYDVNSTWPLTITGNQIKVVDAWTTDGGTTIYMQGVGEY